MSTLHPTYNGKYAGFLVNVAKESKALDKLKQMREAAAKRGQHLCEDALWEGIFALKDRIDGNVENARKFGQLLVAWDGSTALEGGLT